MVLGTAATAVAVGTAIVAAPAVAGGIAAAAATAAGSTAVATGVTTVAATAGTTAITGTLAAATGTATGGASVIASGLTAAAAPLIAAGPVGWLALGSDGLSWDCWKPLVHDDSTEPSSGRLLRDVLTDNRIKSAKEIVDEDGRLHLEVFNIWEEKFLIEFVQVEEILAAHATRF